MKTRTWIVLLGLCLLLCAALSFLLLRPGSASLQAEIYSGGKYVKTVSLLEDQSFSVPAPGGGANTVTVSGGKIAVTSATCPDHHCMARGAAAEN